jgi:membrane associated rhomboid family serine protease
MSIKDAAILIALASAIAFCIVFVISYVFSYFVALKQPPKERALWTVGLSFAAYMAIILSSFPSDYVLVAIASSIISTLLIYLYHKYGFLKIWYDDPSMIPHGIKIANDDWRVGLYLLIAAAVVVLIKKAPVIFAVQQGVGH